jgi:hypothetical protein
MGRMLHKKNSQGANVSEAAIKSIIAELDSISSSLAEMVSWAVQEDFDSLDLQIDSLATKFLEAGLVSTKKLRRLKFHLIIGTLAIKLPDKELLVEQVKTFDDLINSYGDEPSSDEVSEAYEIWEKVTIELKKALEKAVRSEAHRQQPSLPEFS